jgi:drug/metabolite transporter (DMT)-like permease
MKGYLAAAFCVLVWGATFITTDCLLKDFSALEIMIGRFALAWAAMALWSRRRLTTRRRSDEWLFVGMGASGVAVYQLLENCSIYYTEPTNVAILTSGCPVVTALLVRFLFAERTGGWRFWCGVVISLTGVAVVSFDGIVNFRFHPLGDMMALGAMISWSVYSVLIKIANEKGYDQFLVTRRSFFWALVLLVPLAVWGGTETGGLVWKGAFRLVLDHGANLARWADAGNVLSFIFLGLMASVGCYALWTVACRELGVVKSTFCIYLIPVVSIVISMCVTGRLPTALNLMGACGIVLGVALVNCQTRARSGA